LGDQRSVNLTNFTAATQPPNLQWCSWHTWILPFLEQNPLAEQMRPNQLGLATGKVTVFGCPSDPLGLRTYKFNSTVQSTTDYVGIAGTSMDVPEFPNMLGMLYWRSAVRLADVTDGTSNTLLLGERPADPSALWGWWDTGRDPGQWWDKDCVTGTQNTASLYGAVNGSSGPPCPSGAAAGLHPPPAHPPHLFDFHHPWRHPPGAAPSP